MGGRFDYIRDPAEIYRHSFAAIRAEADLARFPGRLALVAERLIHTCGLIEVADFLRASDGAAEAGRAALEKGAPVLVDVEMLAHGVIRSRLPADNAVICRLNDDGVADSAKARGTTRAAAAVELWRPHLEGAVAVIGNAPTALFRLLEMLEDGAPAPALIVGMPVGFVGAVESKQALVDCAGSIPYITLEGRRGGSALAAACVNALGGEA